MRVQTALISIVTLVCTGCPQDPAETVTLHFTGDAKTTELVLKRIVPKLLDPDRMTTVSYQHSLDGRGTLATVSPVSDVERFASGCSFGNITQRDEREFWVSVDPAHAYATVVCYWAVDFTDKLPARLRLWRAIAQSYFVAIVTGQDFGDVSWAIAPSILAVDDNP